MIIKQLIKLSNIYVGTLSPHLSFNFARAAKPTNIILKDFTDHNPEQKSVVIITQGRNEVIFRKVMACFRTAYQVDLRSTQTLVRMR